MILFVATILLLQTPDSAAKPPASWTSEIGVSYVASSGNTDDASFGSNASFQYKRAVWRMSVGGEFIRTRNADLLVGKKDSAAIQMERLFASHISVSSRLSHYADPFADLHALDTAELGLLYRPIDTERSQLSVMGSIARTRETPVSVSGRTYTASRAALSVTRAVHKTARVTGDIDFLYDFGRPDNWKVRSVGSVTANITGVLAIKVAHQYFYAHRPGIGKTSGDSTITMSFVARWPRARSN